MRTIAGTWQDREQIRELYARYSLALDNGDFGEWIDCFTADAVFDSPRFGHYAGHDGFKQFIVTYRESLGGAKVVHLNSNVSFHIEGDQASGICNYVFFHVKDGRAALAALGHYRDRLRRDGDIWRFTSREVFLDARPQVAVR